MEREVEVEEVGQIRRCSRDGTTFKAGGREFPFLGRYPLRHRSSTTNGFGSPSYSFERVHCPTLHSLPLVGAGRCYLSTWNHTIGRPLYSMQTRHGGTTTDKDSSRAPRGLVSGPLGRSRDSSSRMPFVNDEGIVLLYRIYLLSKAPICSPHELL